MKELQKAINQKILSEVTKNKINDYSKDFGNIATLLNKKEITDSEAIKLLTNVYDKIAKDNFQNHKNYREVFTTEVVKGVAKVHFQVLQKELRKTSAES